MWRSWLSHTRTRPTGCSTLQCPTIASSGHWWISSIRIITWNDAVSWLKLSTWQRCVSCWTETTRRIRAVPVSCRISSTVVSQISCTTSYGSHCLNLRKATFISFLPVCTTISYVVAWAHNTHMSMSRNWHLDRFGVLPSVPKFCALPCSLMAQIPTQKYPFPLEIWTPIYCIVPRA